MKKILLITMAVLIAINGMTLQSFATPAFALSEGVLSYIAYLFGIAGIKTYDEFSKRSLLSDALSYMSIEQYDDIDKYYHENAVMEGSQIKIRANPAHIKGILDINRELCDVGALAAQAVLPMVVDYVHDNVQITYDYFCNALDAVDAFASDVILSGVDVCGKLIDGCVYYATDVATAFCDYLNGTSHAKSRVYSLNGVIPINELSDYLSSRTVITNIEDVIMGTQHGNVTVKEITCDLTTRVGSGYGSHEMIKYAYDLIFDGYISLVNENVVTYGRKYKFKSPLYTGVQTLVEGYSYDISKVGSEVLAGLRDILANISILSGDAVACIPLTNERILYHDEVINKAMEKEWLHFPAHPSYFPSVKNPALDWVLDNPYDAGVVINPSLDQILDLATVISVPIPFDSYKDLINKDVHTDDVINWHSLAKHGVNTDSKPWTYNGVDAGTNVGADAGTNVGADIDNKTLSNILAKLGVISVAVDCVMNSNDFNYKPSKLSEISTSGTVLFDKFPFCLPKDFHLLLSILVSNPIEPKFNVNINGYNMRLDFTCFNSLFDFTRSLIVVFFVYKLVFTTKDVLQ